MISFIIKSENVDTTITFFLNKIFREFIPFEINLIFTYKTKIEYNLYIGMF
jgi:hypothetical protein